jgi:hypothetical protein
MITLEGLNTGVIIFILLKYLICHDLAFAAIKIH